jgi:predicted DNA-binding transcriptional regulator YafY
VIPDEDLNEPQSATSVRILYTNYRGVRQWRILTPIRLWHGATEWHPKPQWLLDAVDTEKGEVRSFAMTDIHEWRTG